MTSATLSVSGGRIRAVAHSEPARALLAVVPAAYKQRNNPYAYSYPATPAVALSQCAYLQGLSVQFDEAWLELYTRAREGQEAHESGIVQPLASFPSIESKTTPWEHQIRAFHSLKKLDGAGLFADMGTGKTKVAVDLVNEWGPGDYLIVGPKRALRVWPREFETHSATPVEVLVLEGAIRRRVEILRRTGTGGIRALCTNFEALSYGDFQKALVEHEWAGVIVDEAHRIKSPGSSTSRFLASLGWTTKHRLAMTGTPASDKPLDVWGIFRFIDPGVFGLTYNEFKHRYAIIEDGYNAKQRRSFEQIVGYQNQKELGEILYRHSFRVTKDVLDLPPVIHRNLPVVLNSPTRKAYDTMAKDSVLSLSDDVDVIAPNALAKLTRLMQLSSGFINTPDLPDNTIFGTDKAEVLQEFLADVGPDEPVVVFALFHEEIAQIKRAVLDEGRRVYELSGHQDQLDEWRQDTGGRVLVAQIQAGGVGVSTVEAQHVVYYSHPFSLTQYDQSLSRSHRPGQERTVFYHHLVAEGTVDEYVIEALQNKRDVIEYLLEMGFE